MPALDCPSPRCCHSNECRCSLRLSVDDARHDARTGLRGPRGRVSGSRCWCTAASRADRASCAVRDPHSLAGGLQLARPAARSGTGQVAPTQVRMILILGSRRCSGIDGWPRQGRPARMRPRRPAAVRGTIRAVAGTCPRVRKALRARAASMHALQACSKQASRSRCPGRADDAVHGSLSARGALRAAGMQQDRPPSTSTATGVVRPAVCSSRDRRHGPRGRQHLSARAQSCRNACCTRSGWRQRMQACSKQGCPPRPARRPARSGQDRSSHVAAQL